MIWASGVSKLKRNIWAGILALGNTWGGRAYMYM
jgi:hypothetical protein